MDTIIRRSQWRGRGGFSPHFPILRNRRRLLAPESKKICSFRLFLHMQLNKANNNRLLSACQEKMNLSDGYFT